MSFDVTHLEVPVPQVDELFVAWWEATRDHQFLVQHCTKCNGTQHYPRAICTGCGSTDALCFISATGNGTLYSFSEVFRPAHPILRVPYVVALVRVEEGPLVLTQIVGSASKDLQCDQHVYLKWLPLDDGRALPVFTTTSEYDEYSYLRTRNGG
jgi:hypothetical protein